MIVLNYFFSTIAQTRRKIQKKRTINGEGLTRLWYLQTSLLGQHTLRLDYQSRPSYHKGGTSLTIENNFHIFLNKDLM